MTARDHTIPGRFFMPDPDMIAALLTAVFSSAGDPLADRIGTEAVEHLKQFQIRNVVVVVVQGDRTILRTVISTPQSPRTLTTRTLLPIGSCTKAFTSAAIASLVVEGKLGWDDPVRRHRPTFRLADAEADRLVTIRDLLSHRTGLAGHDLLWYRAAWPLDDAIGKLVHLPLAGPFRKSFHYSSLTFAAGGFAAARADGRSWPELIRARVAKPAGIERIAFTTAEAKKLGSVATGDRLTDDGRLEAMPPYDMAEPNPAGSIHLDAHGLERWLRYQLDPANKFLAETRSPQVDIPLNERVKPFHPQSRQLSYGLGWLVSDEPTPVILHGGMIDGLRTQITLFPRERLGIALVNDRHESLMNVALSSTIADMILDRPAPKSPWRTTYLDLERADRQANVDRRREWALRKQQFATSAVPLEPMTGDYAHPAYGRGRVTLKDGRLTWSWSSFTVPLDRVGDRQFAMTVDPLTGRLIEFISRDGRIAGLTFAEQSFEKIP